MPNHSNVVLVQPKVGYFDFLRTAPAVPLNILQAAALAVEDFDVRIVDQRVEQDIHAALDDAIDANTLAVGFTAFTGPMIRSSLNMTEYVRAAHPGIPIVWGGVHASLAPESTIRDNRIDYVIAGEGESPLLHLLRALQDDGPVDDVPGLYFKRNGAVMQGPANDTLMLARDIPETPFHLVDVSKYLPTYLGQPSLYFQASRGCPYPCTYCYNTVYNQQKFRPIPAPEILRRIKALKDAYDVQNIYFVDDNFFVTLPWAMEIAAGMHDLGVTWQAQGVDIINLKRMDNDYLRKISDYGCQRVSIGVETGSPSMRARLKKAGSVPDILQTLERVVDNTDFLIFLSFMAGFPGETENDVRETVRLVLKLLDLSPKIRTSPIYHLTPYPGTEVFADVVQAGFRPPETLDDWADLNLDTNSLLPAGSAKRRFYESLNFASQFLDYKITEYAPSWPIKAIANCYRPLARYRVRNLQFNWMVEKTVGEKVQDFLFRRSELAHATTT